MSETMMALKETELPSSKSSAREQGLWATRLSDPGWWMCCCEGGSDAAARVAVGWVLGREKAARLSRGAEPWGFFSPREPCCVPLGRVVCAEGQMRMINGRLLSLGAFDLKLDIPHSAGACTGPRPLPLSSFCYSVPLPCR